MLDNHYRVLYVCVVTMLLFVVSVIKSGICFKDTELMLLITMADHYYLCFMLSVFKFSELLLVTMAHHYLL
jgi:hypothetical protein